MIRSARPLAVVAILAAGALGVVSSTQTWLTVALYAWHDELAVAGATAVPVMAPLSLAVLALGLALPIVGRVLRYVFAIVAIAIAVVLGVLAGQVAFAPSVAHVASAVTEATGITGTEPVAQLVAGIGVTVWPALTLSGTLVLLAAGALTVATAHAWPGSGRRYRTDLQAVASAPTASRPHDAIDDWDDLSRGSDPTARPR